MRTVAPAASPAASHALEPSVAFFGAADSRAVLFFVSVALESVRRFHPQSGYHVLVPAAESGADSRWSALLRSWSDGHVKPLKLPETFVRAFTTPGEVPGYSPMTFLRHAVPQLLAERGFRFSVNLDPDVLCVRAWDLSVLLQVKLIAGRPVGNGVRTASWLQERTATVADSSHGSSTSQLNVSSLLESVGLSRSQLSHAAELNGGVLVFNNSAAVQLRWAQTFARFYARLRTVVEGDQDLVSLLLAAKPSFPRRPLPTVYNYAFRRDRERLPYAVAHRLRHGLFAKQAINVHFVMDGKPWQVQELDVRHYPMWQLAARLHHVYEWLSVARTLKPRLPSLRLSREEKQLVGVAGLEVLRASAMRNASLARLADAETRRRCRCFLRSLGQDRKAEPTSLLRGAGVQGDQATTPAAVAKQRRSLLTACGGGGGSLPLGEAKRCRSDLQAISAKFHCALSAYHTGGTPRYSRESANCTGAANTSHHHQARTGRKTTTTGRGREARKRAARGPKAIRTRTAPVTDG